jgi:hypothetical protein
MGLLGEHDGDHRQPGPGENHLVVPHLAGRRAAQQVGQPEFFSRRIVRRHRQAPLFTLVL